MQALLHSVPPTLQQAIADPYLFKKHSQFCLKLCGVSGSWCAQGMFEPSECLWRVWGLILNMILLLLPSCLGFSFALGCGVSFLLGSSILLSMVVQQQVVILDFSQEKMSTCPSTLPFIISLLGDSVQSVVFNSLQPHESQHARPPCPSPTPGVHSNSHPSSP